MAFEDRSSPSAATSPALDAANSPEPSRTSPYTCTTSPKSEPIFRITSFALSSPGERRPPPPPPDNIEPAALNYSIRNILQPEFGKSAVLKTKSIGFKPYESGRGEAAAPEAGAKRPKPKEAAPEADKVPTLWPAWVYCTRYSDRPSSGPRSRRMKKSAPKAAVEDKRPRTAFSSAQLARLKHEFAENRYLTERRRQQLSGELGLNEAQIKIWFQNKRAKIKKTSGQKNPLALQLMAQGLYNHSTMACDDDDMPLSP